MRTCMQIGRPVCRSRILTLLRRHSVVDKSPEALLHQPTQAYCTWNDQQRQASHAIQPFRPFSTTSTTRPADQSKKPYQITTPIYYVNDKPHIGHAYTSIACDVLARYMRLSGRPVFFLSGTDEHGQKVQQSALQQDQQQSPLEFCNRVSRHFSNLLERLNVSNDCFVRTTQPTHQRAVQHLWNILIEKDFIYLGTYEGWYCVRDECFYTESELQDGKAPTGAEVSWVQEESYFFRLSAFQQPLLDFYEQNPGFVAPDGRRNEVLAFVQRGLRDLSVSRTSFSWGVPVPAPKDSNGLQHQIPSPQHVVYVWLDALTSYISALGYPPSGSGESNFEKYWPASVHVVGKDILRFHAVYWPAFLMAAGLPLPQRIFAHGWWTKDGEKMSKSLGNAVDPIDLIEKYGVDQTRFFLMSAVKFGNDGDFSDSTMIYKVNANLANELGNLCQRTLALAYRYNKQQETNEDHNDDRSILSMMTPIDQELLHTARSLYSVTSQTLSEDQAIDVYVQTLVSMIWDANKYFDEMEPWNLRTSDPERMKVVLWTVLEVLRYTAILYQPLIPQSANLILDQLRIPSNERTFAHLTDNFCVGPVSAVQTKPNPVFPRIDACV